MPDSSSLSNEGSAEGLRPRILDAATQLFSELGYAQTSMRAVAEAAGCTKPALYYHFAGKDALFAEAVRAQSSRFSSLIAEGHAVTGSIQHRLTAAIAYFFDCIRQDPQGLRLIYRSVLNPDEGQPELDPELIRGAPVEMTLSLMREGIAAGEVRADLHLDDAILALLGMVDQRCRRFVFEGVPIDADCPHRLVDIFFNGVSS